MLSACNTDSPLRVCQWGGSLAGIKVNHLWCSPFYFARRLLYPLLRNEGSLQSRASSAQTLLGWSLGPRDCRSSHPRTSKSSQRRFPYRSEAPGINIASRMWLLQQLLTTRGDNAHDAHVCYWMPPDRPITRRTSLPNVTRRSGDGNQTYQGFNRKPCGRTQVIIVPHM